MENLFNINQVAFILKVHPLTVRRYIREKKLAAVKIGGSVRIRENDLNLLAKDFTPKTAPDRELLKRKSLPAKPFTQDDPLLRLEGRGASLKLSP